MTTPSRPASRPEGAAPTRPKRLLVKPTHGTYYEGADFVSFHTEKCVGCKGLIGNTRYGAGRVKTYSGKPIIASYCSETCLDGRDTDTNGCAGLWTRDLGVVPHYDDEDAA